MIMFILTGDILKKICPALPIDKANNIAALHIKVCPMYGINTSDIFHEYIANELEESGGFARFTENLNYKADSLIKLFGRHRISIDDANKYGRTAKHPADQEAIANCLYGGEWGRINLGNTQQGDGWLFRGGGPMQLTGRLAHQMFANYYNKLMATSLTAEQIADLVRNNLEVGIHSSAWFFAVVKKLIPAAIADNFVFIVRQVNGGLINLDIRQMYYERAKKYIL